MVIISMYAHVQVLHSLLCNAKFWRENFLAKQFVPKIGG